MGVQRTTMAFAPRVASGVFSRPRLISRLDASRDLPLVIVRAPAGGGKTTLLADWGSGLPHPGVWVTLAPSDGRRLAFWSRVLTALVDSGHLPDGSLLADLAVTSELADELRSALLRGLISLPTRLTLVFDDYHHVQDDAVHDDLHWLLTAGVPLQIVIATRTVTPFEDPAQRARVDTAILGVADLALERDETIAAAQAAGLDEASGVALHDAFAGWPLATRAALVGVMSHPTAPLAESIARVGTTGTADLLASAEDSPYLDFLLRISVAARADDQLCIDLGGSQAPEFLARAEREGLGTWTPDDGRPEFMLQPHLRAYLLAEFDRRMPEESTRLRTIYGKERAERRDPMEAIRQFAAVGNWAEVTTVVRSQYHDMLRLHGSELYEVLRSASPASIRREPALVALLLLLDNARGRLTRTAILHRVGLGVALIQARLGGREPSDRVTLLYALLGSQRLGGHFDSAVDTADRVVATLASLDEPGHRALAGIRSSVWLQAGTSYFYTERTAEAEQLFRVAEEAAAADGIDWVEMHASSMRLLVTAMRGDNVALERDLVVAQSRAKPHGWRGTYSSSGTHLAGAYAALESFDADGARAELAELAEHEHTIEHWPMIARLRGLAALVDGDAFAGLDRLAADIAAHADRPPISRSMSALLAVTRADLMLAAGEPHRALAALRSARRSAAAALALARVDLALGRNDRVIASAAGVAWSEDPLPRSKAEALLATAIAAHRLGRSSDARIATERALDTITNAGLRRPLMMVPRDALAAVLQLTGVDSVAMLRGVPDVFSSRETAQLLTPAELRVLGELRQTGNAENLAASLFLSANTVKSHLRRIYRKLGVTSRDEALAVAAMRGLSSAPPDED
ncbi:MAG: LuxR C-terminal-related transcriptional regulator [Pseudolysinimonas sp.]|uniref:helix-turn-helix transcriptional regulator n=1 Tax=Pseudolysinimonas sp. TaxID=2680009 RepID=UPI0032674D40